jgi:hypothetical protein
VEYARTMKVHSLAEALNPGKTTFLDMSSVVYRAAPAFDAGYFDLVNMQEEPVNDYDKTMLGMVAYIGIESIADSLESHKSGQSFVWAGSEVRPRSRYPIAYSDRNRPPNCAIYIRS